MPSDPDNGSPLDVFLSYAHDDVDYATQLIKHLSTLQAEGLIRVWSDDHLMPGQEWEPEILRRLEASDVVLLLLSASALHSPFISSVEMESALSRHRDGQAHVIPILVRPVSLGEKGFRGIQLLPLDAKRRPRPITSWTNRDQAYVQVVDGVRRAVEQLHTARDVGGTEVVPPAERQGPVQPEPTESPGFRSTTDSVEFDMFLKAPFSSLPPEEREGLLQAIAQLLDLGNVRIVRK